MNDIFLSIIVPVYNMELYLRRCLDSLLRQGLAPSQYEVLLINDGSTDCSRSICEEYTSVHSNFRLIDQVNQGVSAARNHGIDQSRGKFIGFVDADDYLLDNGLYKVCHRYFGREDVELIHLFSSYDNWEICPIDDSELYDGMTHDIILQSGLPSFCWLYLYRKSFLEQYQLRFKPYIVGEDQLFSSSAFIVNAHIVSTCANIYRYVIRENSATTKRNISHMRKGVKDYLQSYEDICSIMSKYGIKKGMPLYNACMKSLNSKKMFGWSRMLSSEYEIKVFQKVRKYAKDIGFIPFRLSAFGWKHRLVIWVMNKSLSSYFCYLLASMLFNRIVIPYIMPIIRKRL